MENFQHLFDFILHFDAHLMTFAANYGAWVYALLFIIIFCETGLVVTPFLPGDSLLFAAGALAASSSNDLNIHLLFLILTIASIIGNSTNYAIGRSLGPKVFSSTQSCLLNRKHLEEAHNFYEKYGGKTTVIARFIPFVRTFAPFVAGIGYMNYRVFTLYNIVGATLWIGSLTYLGYWFGNLPIIKDHFYIIVLIIIGVSLLPPIIALVKPKKI